MIIDGHAHSSDTPLVKTTLERTCERFMNLKSATMKKN